MSASAVFHALTQLLTLYGYPVLFLMLLLGVVGLPIPDEPLMTFCGYLVYTGRLSFLPAFVAGVCGSICGISISYYLGRRFARAVIERFGRYVLLTPVRVARTEALFHQFGPVLLTVGYFVPGMRHFTAVVAGLTGLPIGRFALFAYSGATLWVAVFLSLGYAVGDRWEHTSELVHRYTLYATCGFILLAAAVWLVRRTRRKV